MVGVHLCLVGGVEGEEVRACRGEGGEVGEEASQRGQGVGAREVAWPGLAVEGEVGGEGGEEARRWSGRGGGEGEGCWHGQGWALGRSP